MIDAATFANSYNAFWHANTPTCEHFVRRLNLDRLERFEPPMGKSGTANRTVIAEYAFSLFAEWKQDVIEGSKKRTKDAIEEAAWVATKTRLSPYVDQGLKLNRNFSEEEAREVNEISRRLASFFTDPLPGLFNALYARR